MLGGHCTKINLAHAILQRKRSTLDKSCNSNRTIVTESHIDSSQSMQHKKASYVIQRPKKCYIHHSNVEMHSKVMAISFYTSH